MVENRPYVPPDPGTIRIANSIAFPLYHLADCLEQIENGAVFSGVPLMHFRDSNRTCRAINIGLAISESVIGTVLSRGKPDGFKGKLVRAGGLLMFAHAAVQAKGAFEKSRRQVKLDSKTVISKQDLR